MLKCMFYAYFVFFSFFCECRIESETKPCVLQSHTMISFVVLRKSTENSIM